jgi:hypothetical protein
MSGQLSGKRAAPTLADAIRAAAVVSPRYARFDCGHPTTPENTRHVSAGRIRCLTCHREDNRKWHNKRKGAIA